MWYKYDQNNSGGDFVISPNLGIGPKVWIEADTAAEADERAEKIGIYFDGCQNGVDCDCCGDRWDRAYENQAKEQPNFTHWDFHWHGTVYLHNKNRTITCVTDGEERKATGGE